MSDAPRTFSTNLSDIRVLTNLTICE